MTATFRSPEWFDVPSPCQLDAAAADVWAAGCTLYALMYGQSPFQLAINQVCVGYTRCFEGLQNFPVEHS